MFGLSFNMFTSKTIWGVVLGIIAFLTQPAILSVLPAKVSAIIGAVAALLTAIGVRDAIATNGAASTPTAASIANGKS